MTLHIYLFSVAHLFFDLCHFLKLRISLWSMSLLTIRIYLFNVARLFFDLCLFLKLKIFLMSLFDVLCFFFEGPCAFCRCTSLLLHICLFWSWLLLFDPLCLFSAALFWQRMWLKLRVFLWWYMSLFVVLPLWLPMSLFVIARLFWRSVSVPPDAPYLTLLTLHIYLFSFVGLFLTLYVTF